MRPSRRPSALSLSGAHAHGAPDNTIGIFRASLCDSQSVPSVCQLRQDHHHRADVVIKMDWSNWGAHAERSALAPRSCQSSWPSSHFILRSRPVRIWPESTPSIGLHDARGLTSRSCTVHSVSHVTPVKYMVPLLISASLIRELNVCAVARCIYTFDSRRTPAPDDLGF